MWAWKLETGNPDARRNSLGNRKWPSWNQGFWLVVPTHPTNISEIRSFPQVGVFETTTQVCFSPQRLLGLLTSKGGLNRFKKTVEFIDDTVIPCYLGCWYIFLPNFCWGDDPTLTEFIWLIYFSNGLKWNQHLDNVDIKYGSDHQGGLHFHLTNHFQRHFSWILASNGTNPSECVTFHPYQPFRCDEVDYQHEKKTFCRWYLKNTTPQSLKTTPQSLKTILNYPCLKF